MKSPSVSNLVSAGAKGEAFRANEAAPGWTARSRRLTGIVLVSLTAMNVTPVLTGAGDGLALAAAAAAVFDPFAAFLYVAASQIAPDPPRLSLTLAQLFVGAWLITLPFNGCWPNLWAASMGLRYVKPFMVIWCAIGLANWTLDEILPYAWVTAAILATYLPRANARYWDLLLMLVIGSGLGILGHWGTAAGLPMEGQVYDHAGRGGFRMGSGRVDVNGASVSVGFALWTAVALLSPSLLLKAKSRRLWPWLVAAGIVLLCGIPLLAMGSRGGLGYLIIGGVGFLLYAVSVRSLAGNAVTYSLVALCAMLAVAPILEPYFWDSQPGRMLEATLGFNKEQAQAVGANPLAAGRADIWTHVLLIIANYPLLGVPNGAVVDMGEYGTFIVGGPMVEGAGKGAATHNMLLDLSISRGIPAMIVFAVAFIRPLLDLIRYRGALYALPFAIGHLMTFLCWMNLSMLNWKTFWALHAATAFAVQFRGHSSKPAAAMPRRRSHIQQAAHGSRALP
jgi:hypothetical protein